MTDSRDRDLQDEFDRYFRGDGPPPDTADDPEAAAYEAVFAALHEEPEGDLPAHFAEQVADRVGLRTTTAPALMWTDVVLLFLAVAGVGATLVLMPSLSTVFQETVGVMGRAVEMLATVVRLDVVGAVGLVLALALGADVLIRRWRPLRRAPSPSS
jgi:multisubunit Na+/H+ antiporter MnhB subunit